MDAKKAAQVMKPIYYKHTKAFKYTSYAFAGIMSFTVLFGYLVIQLKQDRLPTSPFTGIFFNYFNSEEYKIRRARIHGLVPPPREIFEQSDKYGNKLNPFSDFE